VRLVRRSFLKLVAGSAALASLPFTSRSDDYPNRPLRLIIGFPPGSASDRLARIIAQWLNKRLGQPVVVEARPGAAGNLSVQAALAAPPDGYTVLMIQTSNVINATLFKSLPFDLLNDLMPVGGLAAFPLALNVNKSFPPRNVAELVSYAGTNPGKISMASFGSGSTSHLAGELFCAATGIKMTHVPYRGSPAAHVDLISGQVQVMFDTLVGSLQHIRSGAIRAIAVASDRRVNELPNVPTVAETVNGFEAGGWTGFSVRKDVRPEVIARLNSEINAGLADPDIQSQLAQAIATPMPMSPRQFGQYIAAETEKWGRVVKLSGATPE
jgi:tripartite-type tricarboxylate transporter receptor subunit TctC